MNKMLNEIHLIDPEAARWIMDNDDIIDIMDIDTMFLACMFVLQDTPQGQVYWSKICDKLPGCLRWRFGA